MRRCDGMFGGMFDGYANRDPGDENDYEAEPVADWAAGTNRWVEFGDAKAETNLAIGAGIPDTFPEEWTK